MLAQILAAVAAATPAPAAPALPVPKTISPLTITAQPKAAPPADVTLSLDGTGEGPDGGQRVSIWPTHAFTRGADGRVTLTCLIDVHGLAEHCRVAFEQPQGMGFGAAALALQPTLKIEPAKGANGQPVAREMNIAMNFKAPDMETDIQQFEAAIGSGHAANLTVQHQPLPMRHVVIMNHPVWVAAPSFDDLAGAYPARAAGAEGYAVSHCGVDRASGLLHRCVAAKELPANRGFGAAAVKLAARFRVSPEVMKYAPHGDPIEVDIPIRFVPPGALDRTVSAPAWIAGVDPERQLKLFPPEAVAKGVTSGRGQARCEVAADGSLKNCAPESAEPDGLGFSETAVKLASTMRMNLWSADAAPVEGGVVHVAVRLNLQPTP